MYIYIYSTIIIKTIKLSVQIYSVILTDEFLRNLEDFGHLATFSRT